MSERLVCTIAPIEAILRLASRYPVFPCRRYPEEIPGRGLMKAKSPLVDSGFHAATQDQEQIRAWWSHWPDALVGVPTGEQTGLLVVDYDVDKVDEAANDWVSEHIDDLQSTRSHTTLSGGRHYLFRKPAGVQYRTGSNLTLEGTKRKGIDLRAEGGYIIWWPLHGGSASGEIAPLPVGLIDEQRVQPAHELPPLPEATPESWARDRERVAKALGYLDPTDYDEWIRTGMAIHLASGGSDDGFNLWHAWSAGELTGDTPTNYTGISDCRYHWSTFGTGRGRPVTLGSVFEAAKAQGYVPERNGPETPPIEAYADEEHLNPGSGSEHPVEREPPLKIVPMDNLATAEIAPIEFVTEPILPKGFVSMLSGHGDAGKTLLALTVSAHVAAGRKFGDLQCAQGRVLFVSLEDRSDLIKLRLRRISGAYEISPETMSENITVLEAGEKNSELAFEHSAEGIRRLIFTDAYKQIRDMAAEHALVVIDNVSDAYDANENERRMVRRFIRGLQDIAEAHSCAVWLLAHLDKAGVRYGTVGQSYSGSTAWHNSVRSRMALTESDMGLELVHEKCNVAKRLDRPIALERNEYGVPMPMAQAMREQLETADQDAVLAAIKAACDMGTVVTTAQSGPKTVTHFLSTRPELPGDLADNPQRIRTALAKLEREGRIWRESYRDDRHRQKEKFRC